MKSIIYATLLSLFLFQNPNYVYSAGKMYEGSADGPCIEWSNKRLTWPQTILGREKAKCRRRGKKPSDGMVTCRLKRMYINVGTKQRMCIYERAGFGLSDVTLSMDPIGACQRSYACDPNK
jgi:hypothetical protein